MATAMVAGGLFNAVAFPGAGYLFNMLNKDGYEKEAERHNRATEELTKARDAQNERPLRKLDRVAELRRELARADEDIAATNRALDQLREVRTRAAADKMPVLSDFYEPSDEMKTYQHVAAGVIGIGTEGASALVLKIFF